MDSYIDFIDAPAVRDHLRTLPPLPPAQQCILIAQSEIRPLADKLAALRAIRAATPADAFAKGCWKFQCDDPFPVILDRYLRVREERLALLEKAEPGVVYVVESDASPGLRTLFSTFAAALATVEPPKGDDWDNPPPIARYRVDDREGESLVAQLTRKLEIAEIDVEGGPNAGSMRIWGGDLPNGYAHVPHPFRRGDIIRQGSSYFVLDESVEETDGRDSWGMDESDIVLYGMSWDRSSGTFGHEHILYARAGTELVAPAALPEKERMLAAVSDVMRDGHALINFLQCFTCGYRDELEKDAVKSAEWAASSRKVSRQAILRSDRPDLPANLFPLTQWQPATIRVQRSGAAEPLYRDTVELTLAAEPRFLGGTGDLTPDDIRAIRAFVVRNLDAFLSHWGEKISFDELRDKLR